MRTVWVFAAIVAASHGADAQTSRARALATASRFFGAQQHRDTGALHAVLHPAFQLVTAVPGGTASAGLSLTATQLVEAVGRATGPEWIVSLHDPVVNEAEGVAGIWSEYSFRRGAAFDHCGTVAIHLVATSSGWKIVQLMDTHRTDGCNRIR